MKLPNWFDFAIVVILLIGMQRGRKRGMSEELLTLLRWVALVAACGFLYLPVGLWLAHETVFTQLSCYIMAYLGLALAVAVVFSTLRRLLGGKLVGSDVFGKAEYYLAMPAGMIRCACMLIFALALLNARAYTRAELLANDRYTKDVYGSDFFPGLHTLQASVYEDSFSGPYIRDYLAPILIKPTLPGGAGLKRKEAPLI